MTADEMRISDWSSDVCSSDLGAAVIARANAFLDEAVPLASGTWADWQGGQLTLAVPAQWVGSKPGGLLLRNNGLHIELVIDADSAIGKTDPARIADLVLEAALTTIIDLDDSGEIGRAHLLTPVTNAHLVCRPLLAKTTTD